MLGDQSSGSCLEVASISARAELAGLAGKPELLLGDCRNGSSDVRDVGTLDLYLRTVMSVHCVFLARLFEKEVTGVLKQDLSVVIVDGF